MQKVIIIKYAELFLKGKNKGYFEQMFFVNIERALKGYKHTLRRPTPAPPAQCPTSVR